MADNGPAQLVISTKKCYIMRAQVKLAQLHPLKVGMMQEILGSIYQTGPLLLDNYCTRSNDIQIYILMAH